MCIYIFVCMYMFIYIYMYMCMYVYVSIFVCLYIDILLLLNKKDLLTYCPLKLMALLSFNPGNELKVYFYFPNLSISYLF